MQNCYSKAQVPALLTEQDERLTAKHIKALTFLQDLGKENKDLKIRVKELELMQKVEQKVEAERQWEQDKRQYVATVESQQKENEALRKQLADVIKDTRVSVLESRVSELEERAEQLTEQNTQLEQANGYQLRELEKLNSVCEHNEHLREQLSEVIQKNKELEFTVRRLQRELTDTGQVEQDELMDTLRVKLSNLHREKDQWNKKQCEYEAEITELKAEIGKLRRALTDSERMRGELHAQLDELLKELNGFKMRVTAENNGQAFREFVQLKRELGKLREENVELKAKVKAARCATVLPSLKLNGVVQPGRPERRVKESSSLSLLGRK